MNESSKQIFDSASEMFDFSKQVANGTEFMAQINAEDIEVGTTKKTKIATFDKVTLYRYSPISDNPINTEPVLIAYGLIGRYTMIDLQDDRSLVRNLLAKGVDLYVIDWGYPSRADQYLGFDEYVNYYLYECVEKICTDHGIPQISLFGICQGGVFSSMFAALYPKRIKNLIISITPIDFAADQEDLNPANGFINLWMRNIEKETIEGLIDVHGNLPGEIMGAVFQALTPMRSLTKYNLTLAELASNQSKLLNFLRMEKWLSDRPHHPGKAAKQWLVNLYQDNQLIKGEFDIDGVQVDLNNITMPVLNVFAEKDHIIPTPCSKAMGTYISSKDYTELPLNGGHVGIYVSSRLQDIVSESIYGWLAERQS